MPDVRNCRKCGRVFNYLGGSPICPACKELDEQDFKKVKEYLYDNPKATVIQVSTDLEISVEKIKRFLKEGRLEIISNEGNMILECENCGRSINSGRLCKECEKELAGNLQSAAGQLKEEIGKTAHGKGGIEMRYLHDNTGKSNKNKY